MSFGPVLQGWLCRPVVHPREGAMPDIPDPAPGTCGVSHPLGAFTKAATPAAVFQTAPASGLSLQSFDPSAKLPALAGLFLSYAFGHLVSSARDEKKMT
jgi:hypothetical protein